MYMEPPLLRTARACRACRGSGLAKILSLGSTPPANAFLTAAELAAGREQSFPLDVYFCNECGLVQLRDAVSPELLFRDYVYVSSTSPAFVAHFESFADSMIKRFGIPPGAFIVDIGSNDGILLKPFAARGMRVLGIDPAREIARRATVAGIETLPEFFTPELARRIRDERGRAVLIAANNVFAHVDNLDGVTEGVRELLAPDGVFVLEVAYLGDFLEKNLFDTVYHEHLFYWAARPLRRYFERFGMELFDIERVPTHGGSIRAFAHPKGAPHALSPAVAALVEDEHRRGLDQLETYRAFAERIAENKKRFGSLVKELKAAGKKIAGYGAPAKGNTLLSYFNIGPDVIEYIVDDSPYKQGLFTPGTHIPVVSAATLQEKPVDYVLILAWNFAPQIMEKLSRLREHGIKFIVPVPEPKII